MHFGIQKDREERGQPEDQALVYWQVMALYRRQSEDSERQNVRYLGDCYPLFGRDFHRNSHI